MAKSKIYTIVCKSAGCNYNGAPDVVNHFVVFPVLVCPRCRSAHVKITALNCSAGETLEAVRVIKGDYHFDGGHYDQ